MNTHRRSFSRRIYYLWFRDRSSWQLTIRCRGVLIRLGRTSHTGWQIHCQQIQDLDILGLYYEVGMVKMPPG